MGHDVVDDSHVLVRPGVAGCAIEDGRRCMHDQNEEHDVRGEQHGSGSPPSHPPPEADGQQPHRHPVDDGQDRHQAEIGHVGDPDRPCEGRSPQGADHGQSDPSPPRARACPGAAGPRRQCGGQVPDPGIDDPDGHRHRHHGSPTRLAVRDEAAHQSARDDTAEVGTLGGQGPVGTGQPGHEGLRSALLVAPAAEVPPGGPGCRHLVDDPRRRFVDQPATLLPGHPDAELSLLATAGVRPHPAQPGVEATRRDQRGAPEGHVGADEVAHGSRRLGHPVV